MLVEFLDQIPSVPAVACCGGYLRLIVRSPSRELSMTGITGVISPMVDGQALGLGQRQRRTQSQSQGIDKKVKGNWDIFESILTLFRLQADGC